jgi:imidazole glycerol phosphate synthase subunit HisF
VAKAGQLVRATANPFFMGVDYGTLIKNLRVINELISHKDDLIRSNTKVIDQMDLELKAANEKYLDCAGRAMEAIRKFVERKKETEAWIAQQNQARRQRLRGTFGG